MHSTNHGYLHRYNPVVCNKKFTLKVNGSLGLKSKQKENTDAFTFFIIKNKENL